MHFWNFQGSISNVYFYNWVLFNDDIKHFLAFPKIEKISCVCLLSPPVALFTGWILLIFHPCCFLSESSNRKRKSHGRPKENNNSKATSQDIKEIVVLANSCYSPNLIQRHCLKAGGYLDSLSPHVKHSLQR